MKTGGYKNSNIIYQIYIFFGVASCSQPLIKIAIRHLLPLEFSTEALPSARIAYAFTEFPYILEDLMCFVE